MSANAVIPTSLRLPPKVYQELNRQAGRVGKSFTEYTREVLQNLCDSGSLSKLTSTLTPGKSTLSRRPKKVPPASSPKK